MADFAAFGPLLLVVIAVLGLVGSGFLFMVKALIHREVEAGFNQLMKPNGGNSLADVATKLDVMAAHAEDDRAALRRVEHLVDQVIIPRLGDIGGKVGATRRPADPPKPAFDWSRLLRRW